MATARTLVTAEELIRLPDDGNRYELVLGELRTMTPGSGEHGSLVMNLSTPLDTFVRAHHLGRVFTAETGFRLAVDPDTVRVANVAFMRRERIAETRRPGGYWFGAPDLVAEFISPNDLYTEVDDKVAAWLAHGARMMIVVNPRRRTVTVHRPPARIRLLTDADTLDGEDVVPDWTLPVRDLFMDDAD